MGLVERVLPNNALETLAAAEEHGAGVGLKAARGVPADTAIEVLRDAGLRGRGGAGFPTWRKWRTVADFEVPGTPTTVVVNAAEGEPGCFKDRLILRRNPYAVLEGALIAAHAVAADRVIVATKSSFTNEIDRVDRAITEIEQAGWTEGIDVSIFRGPGEYLYGEETGLLEAIDGRPPFPRVVPPYRHGVDEELDAHANLQDDSSSPAHIEMAAPTGESDAPPTLAQNVETLANVPAIFANGADWFRSLGTAQSPGTIVCTVSGRVQHAGVAEVELGTPLGEIIELIGGGPEEGHELAAVMFGVSSALVPAKLLDTPATYEDVAALGSGLGAASLIVYDDTSDLAAVAAGVARFLAVESCGQCRHCKQDGLELADLLDEADTLPGRRQRARPDRRPARHRGRGRAVQPRVPAAGDRRQRPHAGARRRRRAPPPRDPDRARADRAHRRARAGTGRPRRAAVGEAARLALRARGLGAVARRPPRRAPRLRRAR